jgi:putative ABC transport system permease protein
MGRFVVGLGQGSRRLRRSPVFTVITVLSVAFGVATFGSILSVADGVLLETPPYRDVERLEWVWRDYTWANFPRGWLGGPDIALLRERTEAFDAVVGFRAERANLTASDGGAAEEVRILQATDEFFEVIGVQPMLGRGFASGESDSTAAPVVVLAHDLWQRRFGGDRGVIGQDVFLDGLPRRVIGVMPRGFRFVMHASLADPMPADLYEVMQVNLGAADPGSGSYAGLAQIRAGEGEGVVSGALQGVARQLDEESFGNRGLRLWSVPLREDLIAQVRPVLGALLGASLFLLLTLGANLATLLFARASSRSRDVAVRSALGAGRFLSITDLLAESLLISLAGGVLGLAITPFIVNALLGLAPPSLPRLEAIGVDGSVIAITLAMVTLLAFASVLGPAMRVSARPAWEGLRASGPRAGGTADAARTRSVLVAVQVALSLVLLVSATLVARGVAGLLRADPGFDPQGVLVFRVPVPGIDDPGAVRAARFHEELRERLATLPGVSSAGAADAIPLLSGANQTGITFPNAPGNTGDPDVDAPLVDYLAVTPSYFATMGIGLLEGRPIDSRDVEDAPPVALIDETLARRFFPDGSATGRQMTMNGNPFEIIGVTRHARHYSVFADDRGQVYRPLAQMRRFSMYHTLRSSGDAQALIEPARQALRELDSTIPMAEVTTMRAVVRTSLGQHRLSLVLIAGFATGALVLAAMGLYGVVSNSVLRRQHEFGVRLALGADRPGILGLVFVQGVRVVAFGLIAGLLGAIAAARLLASVLFGIDAGAPSTYALVGLFLAGVGLFACLVPAWRATRIAPIEALRAE